MLSTIPYRYDRFVKTDKQKKLDKEQKLESLQFLKFGIDDLKVANNTSHVELVRIRHGPLSRS